MPIAPFPLSDRFPSVCRHDYCPLCASPKINGLLVCGSCWERYERGEFHAFLRALMAHETALSRWFKPRGI